MYKFLSIFAFALLPAALVAQAKIPNGPAEAAIDPRIAPARYKAPAVGMKLNYSRMSSTITRVDGFRTYFTDHRGKPGLWHGIFVSDNPEKPLTVQSGALDKLWPLRVGNVTDVITARGSERWLWRFTVVAAETISVAAGRFATYRVDGVEQPLITSKPGQTATVIQSWWYAPELGVPVRVNYLRAAGNNQGLLVKQDLISVEKPKS